MLTVALAIIAFTSASQDLIDFKLEWKKGDKFEYVISLRSVGSTKESPGPADASGDLTLTVTGEDEKGFTVTTSRVEFVAQGRFGAAPYPAATLRISRKGEVSFAGGGVAPGPVVYLRSMAFPEEPVSVGDSFEVNKLEHFNPEVKSTLFTGKFVSLSGGLATLETEGSFMFRKTEFVFHVKTIVDTSRGVIVSHSITQYPLRAIFTMKLKGSTE